MNQKDTEKDQGSGYVVIGEEFAKAVEEEKRRKASGPLQPSPMPAEKYETACKDLGLIRPEVIPLDLALAGLCRTFKAADEHTRQSIRQSLNMDDFYTLLAFSKRTAVFALREKKADWVDSGLTAIAMVEVQRVDYRDVLWTLSLLNYSAEKIDSDAKQLFELAGKMATPEMDQLLNGFISRSPDDKDLRSSWGYDEIETEAGIGLIGYGFKPYQPTHDLAKIAIEIADYVATDKYEPNSVEIATELPEVWLITKHVWLRPNHNKKLKTALRNIRGGASISFSLRPAEHPNYQEQMFVIFLVEATNSSVSDTLFQLSRKTKPTDYSIVGVASGPLFCLAVARSFVAGVESFETMKSLNRFSDGLSSILKRHVGR